MFSHANSWVRFFILYLAGSLLAECTTVCIPGIILMHLKYSSIIDLFEGSQRIWISLFINSVAKLAGSFWLLIVGLCIAKGGKFDRQNNILDGLCVCEQMWHSTLFQLFIHVSTTR